QSGQRGTGRLGVKIFTSGKKQFVFRYYQQQKEKFISIGLFSTRAGSMTLTEAREKAQVFSQLLLGGKDPKLHLEQQESEQKKIDAESKSLGTIDELFHSYTERMKIDGKRTYEDVRNALVREFYPYIDRNTKACDVTTDDIKYVISKMIQRGAITQSNRV
ncbi:Arm DNA-binding domain-containing protein, partial [Vibrio fluvialis]|uniref:Arm DNA-binding domain-containing protein n=2 Tax=Vibrio TaxID=662 RepID=UPI001EEB7E1D